MCFVVLLRTLCKESIETVQNGGDPIGTVRVTKQLQLIRLILREEVLD